MERSALFVEPDSFKVFLDSGLSERLLVRSYEVALIRDNAEVDGDSKVAYNRRRVWRSTNYNVPFPTHRARAVYHEPSLSVGALAYLSNILSRTFVSTAMSDRYGLMCSAFQRSRVRKSSANLMAGSVGCSAQGK
jgi:hypothetical protein